MPEMPRPILIDIFQIKAIINTLASPSEYLDRATYCRIQIDRIPCHFTLLYPKNMIEWPFISRCHEGHAATSERSIAYGSTDGIRRSDPNADCLFAFVCASWLPFGLWGEIVGRQWAFTGEVGDNCAISVIRRE
jgi:hypothetical protein